MNIVAQNTAKEQVSGTISHAKRMKVKPKERGEGLLIFEYRITAA